MLWTFNFPGCKQRPHLCLPIPAENGLNERLSLYLERSAWNWKQWLILISYNSLRTGRCFIPQNLGWGLHSWENLTPHQGSKAAQATETLLEKPTIKAVKAAHTLPPSPLSLNSPFLGNASQFREWIFWSMREVNWNEARQDAATSLFIFFFLTPLARTPKKSPEKGRRL